MVHGLNFFISPAVQPSANDSRPEWKALKDIETKLKFYRDTNSTPENYDMEANFFLNQVLTWYPRLAELKQKQRHRLLHLITAYTGGIPSVDTMSC